MGGVANRANSHGLSVPNPTCLIGALRAQSAVAPGLPRSASVCELAGFVFPQPSYRAGFIFPQLSWFIFPQQLPYRAGFILPQPSCFTLVPALELRCCELAFSRLVQVPREKSESCQTYRQTYRACSASKLPCTKSRNQSQSKQWSSISTALYMTQKGVVQHHEVQPLLENSSTAEPG